MKKNGKSSIGVVVLAAVAVLLWSGMAPAGDPVVGCQAAKLKAAGKRAQCLAGE